MTTGLGSCANCGTPRVSPQQLACNLCGAAFSSAPTWSPPAQPAWQQQPPAQPAWQQQPAQQPPVWQPPAQTQQAWQQPQPPQAPQQPAWQQPQQGWQQSQPGQQDWSQQPEQSQPGQQDWSTGYQQGYAGYPPAKSSNKGMIAAIVGVVGVVVVVAIIFAAVLIANSGKNNSGGSITFSPQTFGCGTTQTISSTVRLPASVGGTTTVTFYNDGVAETTFQVSTRFTKQTDNSWVYNETENSGTFTCTSSGGASVGKHNVSVQDQTGKVLGSGSYTVTP
jgi:hypothetical protein